MIVNNLKVVCRLPKSSELPGYFLETSGKAFSLDNSSTYDQFWLVILHEFSQSLENLARPRIWVFRKCLAPIHKFGVEPYLFGF